ncbi:hypothetical protein H0H93_016514, partial [Arthromyces matolae]
MPKVPGLPSPSDVNGTSGVKPASSMLTPTASRTQPPSHPHPHPVPPPVSASSTVVMPPTLTSPHSPDDDEGDITDDEDEFFDAIESGTLPVVIPAALSSPPMTLPTPSAMTSAASSASWYLFGDASSSVHIPAAPYASYLKLRGQLDLGEERPSASLWSVLKHSIGKDLTKISFPVFFNEPTSMLQRMAEDMEFSEC